MSASKRSVNAIIYDNRSENRSGAVDSTASGIAGQNARQGTNLSANVISAGNPITYEATLAIPVTGGDVTVDGPGVFGVTKTGVYLISATVTLTTSNNAVINAAGTARLTLTCPANATTSGTLVAALSAGDQVSVTLPSGGTTAVAADGAARTKLQVVQLSTNE